MPRKHLDQSPDYKSTFFAQFPQLSLQRVFFLRPSRSYMRQKVLITPQQAKCAVRAKFGFFLGISHDFVTFFGTFGYR
jgi:hypothetical protein